jgi:hypothetical protein
MRCAYCALQVVDLFTALVLFDRTRVPMRCSINRAFPYPSGQESVETNENGEDCLTRAATRSEPGTPRENL